MFIPIFPPFALKARLSGLMDGARRLPGSRGGSGINAGLSFSLPFNDLGAGQVDLTAATAAGSGTATFTRATTATTILSTGLLTSVASGVARSRYSAAGVYLGYLAEQASTNLCLQSQTFDNASWTPTNATVTADAAVAPDGTTTADALVENTVNNEHLVFQTISKAASAITYTDSVFVKAGTRSWFYLTAYSPTPAIGMRKFFQLSGAGAIGSTVAVGAGFTFVSASITSFPNGWYLCQWTYTTEATGTTLQFTPSAAPADATVGYIGTASAVALYLWGAQREQLSFRTSYIPTVAAAVTRNADALTYPSAGNVLGTEGAVYSEVTTDYTGATSVLAGNAAIVSAYNGAALGQLLYVRQASSVLSQYDGTSERLGIAFAGSSSVQKVAGKWSASGSATRTYLAGAAGSANAFDGDMNFGASVGVGANVDGTGCFNGTIKNVRIWQRALTDNQLTALTT
jgi:hypothetical protein